jgi:hypothetical protein
MRGNRTKAAPASGSARPSIFAPIHRRVRSGGTAPVSWNDSWVASSATSEASISSAVGIVCE